MTAERVRTPVDSAHAWFADYLCRPHEFLGRDGTVCPFVEPSLKANSLRVEEWRLPAGITAEALAGVVERMTATFAKLDRAGRNPALHALVVVLPQLGAAHGALLDQAQRRAKTSLVRRGLMLGQFHPHCDERAARNGEFPVSRAPVAMFALRRMAFHDVLFLDSDPEWFAAYRDRFGTRYRSGTAPDPLFAELFHRAQERWEGKNHVSATPPDLGVSSDTERAARAGATDGEPVLDFAGQSTPYIDYQSIDVLLSLQHPRSPAPSELPFYILGQVKELLFKLVYEELVRVRSLLDGDRVPDAVWGLHRLRRVVELLVASWDVLGTLAPTEFNAFRDHLGQASGFQSYMYRMVEFALGNKAAELARAHRGVPHVHRQVQEVLHAPSVYDAALRLLARRGAAIPAGVLERDFAAAYEPSDAVERAWAEVYRTGGPADETFLLAEALMGVAEAVGRWRSVHLLTVERIIGTKPGTGGTLGTAWLRRVNEHRFFPELWTCRGLL
ncbi:tryptophan 2,3-dioxygenase [Streptomyces inhibens]|uniref:tryptophan 2,3-dioxygenase n=1 Tax=Streptomyces inhibens TaxID=2293571 RepID=UPI0037BAACE7